MYLALHGERIKVEKLKRKNVMCVDRKEEDLLERIDNNEGKLMTTIIDNRTANLNGSIFVCNCIWR